MCPALTVEFEWKEKRPIEKKARRRIVNQIWSFGQGVNGRPMPNTGICIQCTRNGHRIVGRSSIFSVAQYMYHGNNQWIVRYYTACAMYTIVCIVHCILYAINYEYWIYHIFAIFTNVHTYMFDILCVKQSHAVADTKWLFINFPSFLFHSWIM